MSAVVAAPIVPTRGERNNNPGNIERQIGTTWMGASPDQSKDPRFVQFMKIEYGLRALARVLVNYTRLHDADTLREIINRWAPTSENKTAAYLEHVCKVTGFPPDAKYDVQHLQPLASLCRAICIHENGRFRESESTLLSAVQLALRR